MRLTPAQLADLQAKGRIRTHLINPAPKSKYRNKRTLLEGIAFDSRKEAKRWEQLLLLQAAKEISELERQVRYELRVNGHSICAYVADFRYLEKGVRVVEDAKGVRTRDYIIKARLMKAIFDIEIKET